MPTLSSLVFCLSFFLALHARAAAVSALSAGATPDGKTLNTPILQKAIDSLSASGGGTLTFPSGQYLTGTLQLKSNVTLHLDQNATLLGSPDAADYRNLDPFTDGSGNPMGHALLVALDADHVTIEGPGAIDGQGARLAANQHPYTLRPFLVRFVRCNHITVKDVHLQNPGAWTLNFFQSDHATIDHITIRSRDQKLRNNDGVNIDSSTHITVKDCDVISGDDALVIKATAAGKPSAHISAQNCKLSTHTNAIKLGTESIGGFSDVSISHCAITDTDMAGIALYEVDGGDLENVSISDVTMDGVAVPISIRLGARLKTFRDGDSRKTAPGRLDHIAIKNVSAKNIKLIGILINGLPGHPVQNVSIDHLSLTLPGGGADKEAAAELPEKPDAYPEYNMFGKSLPASAIYIRHAQHVSLKNLTITLQHPDARPEKVLIDVAP